MLRADSFALACELPRRTVLAQTDGGLTPALLIAPRSLCCCPKQSDPKYRPWTGPAEIDRGARW